MSLEKEDQSSLHAETPRESQKYSKIAYARDFLLSLSELDICKRLPSGFDHSILSEFEDASFGKQDRQRIPGSFLLEYGSSPPTKGDPGNYSRGVYGRWGNRSFARNDEDSDTQSDRESVSSESGSYSNQSRKSWQRSEHDGLLGSGSFPRPSGYASGVSAPKVANDQYQLNKTSELYQPPRPYKAVPHARRETKDTLNDETFGSTEFTTEDRADEERKRRASFELMRKDQQRALKEKQKSNSDNRRTDTLSDIFTSLEDTKDENRPLIRNNEFSESVTLLASNNDTEKSSFPSQTPASRPLVPPGFRSTTLEKNSGMKSSIHASLTETGKSETGGSLSHAKANFVQNGTLSVQEEREPMQEMDLSEQQLENLNIHAQLLNKGEKIMNMLSPLGVSDEKLGMNDPLYRASSFSESHGTADSGEIIELGTREVTTHRIGNSNQVHSTSILDKLFGGASTMNTGSSSGFVEVHDKQDDPWSPHREASSKFAHWFLEEERKPGDELISSSRPSDLLSLIVGGEKGGSQVLDVKEFQNLIAPDTASAATGISDQLYVHNKQEAVSTILTCADLEQTILSEFSENRSTSQQTLQEWSVSSENIEHPKVDIDTGASQHLLSLLQKGTGPKEMIRPFELNTESSYKLHVPQVEIRNTGENSIEENAENIQSLSKTLTLETLFGTAFMKELKSVEAPLSVHRGSVGSSSTDVSESHGFPSSIGEIESNRKGIDSFVLAQNHGHQTKLNKIDDSLVYNDPQSEVNPLKLPSEVVSIISGVEGTDQIPLPEDESLFMPGGHSTKGESLTSNIPVDIAEKLATLNTVFKDERSMVGEEGPPLVHGPYSLMGPEIPYHNPLTQQSSTQFRGPQTNHRRSFLHPFDSRPGDVNSQMKFMGPESVVHHGGQPNHQFPANILRPPINHDAQLSHQFPANLLRPPISHDAQFPQNILCPPSHNPNAGLTKFDLPGQNHPMFQQMQMLGNFPPHLLREVPRGPPLPQHSSQPTGFIHGSNPMQGRHFGPRQPDFGGLGRPMTAPEVNSRINHPETFQRLMEMEMEMRARSKQVHPYGNAGQSQGLYGNELDMGFQFR